MRAVRRRARRDRDPGPEEERARRLNRRLENATTHECVAVEVADDGRVHAERATGGRVDAVDADSFEALKRDHPEFVDALRAFRIDYRFSWSFTAGADSD